MTIKASLEAFPAAALYAQRHPWMTLLVTILLTGAALVYAATSLGINTDTTDMLSEELPFRQNLVQQRDAFPQYSNAIVVVVEGPNASVTRDAALAFVDALRAESTLFRSVFYPAGDSFFRTNGLLYQDVDEIESLTNRLAAAQGFLATLSNDPSLRGLSEVLVTALEAARNGNVTGDAVIGDLAEMLSHVADTVRDHADGGSERFPWDDVIGGTMLAEDEGGAGRQIVLVQPVLDFGSLSPAAEAMRAIRNTAAAQGLVPENGFRVRLTGSAALSSEELRSVRDSMGLVGALTVSLVGLLLALALRSLARVISLLVTLVCGLILTAGFAALAIGELNLISVAFAVLFIGLGVDYGIHLILRHREELRLDGDHAAALRRTVGAISIPLVICAVTGVISFFSFLPTAYRGLSELGLISGVGLLIGLALTLTLLPALLRLLPDPLPQSLSASPGRFARLQRSPSRSQALAISMVAGVLAVGAIPFAAQIEFDSDPMNLRDPATESVKTFRDLMADEATRDVRAVALASDLETARTLAEQLRDLPEVRKVVSLHDYVPAGQEEKLAVIEGAAFLLAPVLLPSSPAPAPGIDVLLQSLKSIQGATELTAAAPETPPGVAQAARELSRAIESLFRMAPDARDLGALQDKLINRLPRHLSDLENALNAGPVTLESIPAELRDRMVAVDGRARLEIYPYGLLDTQNERRAFVGAVQQVAPTATGTPSTILAAGDAVVTAMTQATALAIVCILIFLAIVLRRLADAVLVLIPIALAAVFTAATAVLFGLPLNFANVIVLPLLLGLGVDSGVHIVLRSREQNRTLRGGEGKALGETSTPRAVVFSALTTIASFGSLSVSSHVGTASMGQLLTIALLWTLVTTLIVLPALLALTERVSTAPESS